jgi:outer membrane protein assembly factor BamA
MHRPAQPRARARVVAGVTLLVAAVLAFAPSRLLAQREDQREAPEVRELELRGVRSVPKRDLERSIATTKSECKSLLLAPFCWVSKSPTFVDKKHLNRDEFRRDVLRVLVFYWKRGYREAQVDTVVTRLGPGTVRVVFDIHEGRPTVIQALRVEYDSTLMTPRRVQRLSILRAGDPLNLVVLDTMRASLQLEMWNKGYADAQVDTIITVDTASRTARVTLRANPNWKTTIGQVTVRGNNEVSLRTIQNSILLRPGRPFRYVDLVESQRNLYESNLFRLAIFTVPPKRDSVKNVNIDLRETKMREARVAVGFNNVEFLQGDARYTNYNTFGGARRLDVTGMVGNLGAAQLNGRPPFREIETSNVLDETDAFLLPTWSISGDLKQPAWLRKPENALAIGGFAHRRAAPAVFVDRGYGGQVSFTRTLAPRASASSAYRFEITRVEASDVYYCVNYGVCDDTTMSTLRRHQKLSPLQLSASIDRSDIPFSPTKGFIGRVDLEHASSITVSEYRYNRAYAEGAVYTHFLYPSRDARAQVLAAHLRLGFVRPLGTNVLHPRTRFYAGGSQSVRGFGENELGPKILTIPSDTLAKTLGAACDTSSAIGVQGCDPNAGGLRNQDFTVRPVGGTSLLEASVEYRMPFARKMEWAVFLDGAVVGGNAIGNLSDSLSLPRFAAALTPGVGFRYKSPVGPIRIDLGYNPRIVEHLPVLTTVTDSAGRRQLVALDKEREHISGGTASGFWSIFNRMVLHLSIGQAY